MSTYEKSQTSVERSSGVQMIATELLKLPAIFVPMSVGFSHLRRLQAMACVQHFPRVLCCGYSLPAMAKLLA